MIEERLPNSLTKTLLADAEEEGLIMLQLIGQGFLFSCCFLLEVSNSVSKTATLFFTLLALTWRNFSSNVPNASSSLF